MHMKGCSVVCCNNVEFEPKRLMCLCSYCREELRPKNLRHKVLKQVGLKSALTIDICVMGRKKKSSFKFDWDSRLDLCYSAIADISNYLKYQSRQHMLAMQTRLYSNLANKKKIIAFTACVC